MSDERPEVEALAGCAAVLAIGGTCHAVLMNFLWRYFSRGQPGVDVVFSAVVAGVLLAPFVIPTTGFVGLWLLRLLRTKIWGDDSHGDKEASR